MNLALPALLVLVAGVAWAAPSPSPTSAPATAPARKLMPAEHVLMPIRNRYSLPAMAAGVIIHGRLAVIGAVGVRKAGSDVKVTRDDEFHIGSCTKAMTATLVAELVDQGRLRWDMTLPEALPDLAEAMNASYRKATLRQLLCHRAGLVPNSPPGKSFGEYFNLPGTLREQRMAYAREILKADPQGAPGEKFLYSNAGYAIAGAIAERAADTEFHELMRKMLFEPLGMKSAAFGAMGTPDKLDQPFQHALKDGKFVPVGPGQSSDNPVVISAAGRVHCTITDWAKFIEAHLNGFAGRPTGLPIKPETWKALHEAPHGGQYALGWSVTDRDWGGGQVFTHAGSNTMNYCVMWVAPKRDYAVLVATNQGGDQAFKACDEAAGMLIGAFPPGSPGEPGTLPAAAGGGR